MASLTTEQSEILDLALDLPEDQLYALLGEDVALRRLGVSPDDPDQQIKEGKTFFSKIWSDVRAKICSDRLLTELDLLEKDDKRKAAIQIINIVVAHAGGIPAVYVSLLLIRAGLRKICGVKSDQ